MFVKIHKTEKGPILAACDEHLIGMNFREEGKRLDVSEIFYKGESVGREVLVERMKNVYTMNLVGDEVVSIAIEEGYASEENIVEIDGVKIVQVVII